MQNAANSIYGSIDGNVDRSAVPVGTVGEDVYTRKDIYLSYTHDNDQNIRAQAERMARQWDQLEVCR